MSVVTYVSSMQVAFQMLAVIRFLSARCRLLGLLPGRLLPQPMPLPGIPTGAVPIPWMTQSFGTQIDT